MTEERKTPYRLPQENGEASPEAEEAAVSGDVPEAAEGMAGESEPGEPSRAEIFALDPSLAGDNGTSVGGPTMPEGPIPGEPHVAGAPTQGKTEPLHSAPPAERPEWSSTPEERFADQEPPKAGRHQENPEFQRVNEGESPGDEGQ